MHTFFHNGKVDIAQLVNMGPNSSFIWSAYTVITPSFIFLIVHLTQFLNFLEKFVREIHDKNTTFWGYPS